MSFTLRTFNVISLNMRIPSRVVLGRVIGWMHRDALCTPNSLIENAPVWSPDGTKLACVSGFRVYIINADGKGKKITIRIPFAKGSVSWSPDGNWIACAGSAGMIKRYSIFLASVDGKEQKMLTESTGDFCPVWSPRSTP